VVQVGRFNPLGFFALVLDHFQASQHRRFKVGAGLAVCQHAPSRMLLPQWAAFQVGANINAQAPPIRFVVRAFRLG